MKYIYTVLSALLLISSPLFSQDGTLRHPQPPEVPESVKFAGETIRFDRIDIYERMDRELISFTYTHTNTTLMLKKADRVFSEVVPILRKEGVPEDLKYLMAIESNLNPKSLSSAEAAGLWQFTKATAKEYGLEVSTEVDERYNTEKATRAACAYLKKAYEKYGNWMTVAASYNGGQNGITKKLADQRQSHAMDLWLVDETSRYMFRILAAKMLFENPSAFGYSVGAKDMYPRLKTDKVLTVSTPVESLVDLAEENGVSYAQLKEANLWLRSDHLTNKALKTYKIVIPAL